MLNYIFYKLQRPEKGWDPITTPYARAYAEKLAPKIDFEPIINDVNRFVGDLTQKKVLDLGAGAGYFAAKFAGLGAMVTWQDISHYHLQLFRSLFPDSNMETQLGYMEEASGEYDLVFNRLCWYYSMDDKKFAHHIVRLMKPGGMAYLIIPNEGHEEKARKEHKSINWVVRRLQYFLNNQCGIKIGHPFISTSRLKRIFSGIPLKYISFMEAEDTVIVKIIK